MSSEKISASFSVSCTSSESRRTARPSAMAVLPTPASPTNTGLFLRRRHSTSMVRCSSSARPISGSSSPCAGARGEVDAVRGERIPCRAPTRDRRFRPCRRARRTRSGETRSSLLMGVFVMPCARYSSTSSRVMPCSASSGGRAGLRLLQNGREQVADLRLLPLRALHVQHGRLQRPAERRRLLGLALLSAREGPRPTRPGCRSTFRRSSGRSAPQAARMRSPSGSWASA